MYGAWVLDRLATTTVEARTDERSRWTADSLSEGVSGLVRMDEPMNACDCTLTLSSFVKKMFMALMSRCKILREWMWCRPTAVWRKYFQTCHTIVIVIVIVIAMDIIIDIDIVIVIVIVNFYHRRRHHIEAIYTNLLLW